MMYHRRNNVVSRYGRNYIYFSSKELYQQTHLFMQSYLPSFHSCHSLHCNITYGAYLHLKEKVEERSISQEFVHTTDRPTRKEGGNQKKFNIVQKNPKPMPKKPNAKGQAFFRMGKKVLYRGLLGAFFVLTHGTPTTPL